MLERLGLGERIGRLGARHVATELRLSDGGPRRTTPSVRPRRTEHGDPPGRPARAARRAAAAWHGAAVPAS